MISADSHWRPVMCSRFVPGRRTNANRSAPASMKRTPAMRNGGMLSIAMRIVRYVDPQIRYTAANAITTATGDGRGMDTRCDICYTTNR